MNVYKALLRDGAAKRAALQEALNYLEAPQDKLWPAFTLTHITDTIRSALAENLVRQPLTHEQIADMLQDHARDSKEMHDFARAVERAHGIGSTAWQAEMKAKADATFNRDWDTPLGA